MRFRDVGRISLLVITLLLTWGCREDSQTALSSKPPDRLQRNMQKGFRLERFSLGKDQKGTVILFPGQQAAAKLEISGFRTNQQGEAELDFEFQLVSLERERVMNLNQSYTISPTRIGGRETIELDLDFQIPADLLPGTYNGHLHMRDRTGDAAFSRRIPVRIVAY